MQGGTHTYIIKFLTDFFTETQTSKPIQNPMPYFQNLNSDWKLMDKIFNNNLHEE